MMKQLEAVKEAFAGLLTECGISLEPPPAPAEPEKTAADAPPGEKPVEKKPAAAAKKATGPIAMTDYKQKGFHLDVTIPADQAVASARILDRYGYTLEAVTGVDWLADKQLEVVYDYNHFAEHSRVVVRTRVARDKPELPTISGVFPGANWHERETHDFFGIKFLGHPDLSPLLLPEDADFHPLLKDYTP